MEKFVICVPEGIRYMSEWKGYDLNNYAFPHILNKTLTGCGYTEYCIQNNQNLILCSPRRILLENKESQHPGEVYYARNDIENSVNFERDLSGDIKPITLKKIKLPTEEEIKAKEASVFEFKENVWNYYTSCKNRGIPCKFLVTYDSFRLVRDALGGCIGSFQIVVDEFQSVLIDAKFKSTTELGFLNQLKDLQRICFVSATPLMDKYLEKLDEFKNLPYYELDWKAEDPGRVKSPDIFTKFYKKSLNEEINRIVEKYLEGKFEVRFLGDRNNPVRVESREAVIYVNSVKTICSIIKKNGLTIDNTNVLCAKTSDNEDKIRKAFGLTKKKMQLLGVKSCIGSVPKRGEPHKMFTFCTRTVYLGADFYSECARTFVFSDANVDCLSVDVSMDLEQILGRQRLDINPWKNSAEIFIKFQLHELTKEDFDRELKRKISKTNNLLLSYSTSPTLDAKHDLAEKYESDAKNMAYKNDYVAVDLHAGSDIKPVFNNLMLVAEERTFEVQQMDYKDRFTIFNALGEIGVSLEDPDITRAMEIFNDYSRFTDKMKFASEMLDFMKKSGELGKYNTFLNRLPGDFKNYIQTLGIEELKSIGYQKSKIIERLSKTGVVETPSTKLVDVIYEEFLVGDKYSKSWIKDRLKNLYNSFNFTKTAKASDLEEYFELKPCLVSNKETGKRDAGFEIVSRK